MARTLKDLAGATFHAADVIAGLHTPIPAEEAVLDRYVFVPHVRSGIAAAVTQPFAWGMEAHATVQMTVPINDDRGHLDAAMAVRVHGPGDVAELDHRQVVRTWPKADAHDAEASDLVQVEFDLPELPWLFTPAAPVSGRLVPWVTLVVAETGTLAWGGSRGATRVASIRRDQLQPLDDAWAFAHAQVMGAKQADPASEPTLQRRLAPANAAFNVSRLLCPRRLRARTSYVACVVPTFSAGSLAGRGLTPDEILLPAWGDVQDFGAGDPHAMVELPVYYSWRFSTGEDANFESLARKVKPAVAPPGVGRRRVDVTHPFVGVDLDADDPGAEMVVEGPVVSPQDPPDDGTWPSEADQHWSHPVTDRLVDLLNPAGGDDPLVRPPLYGSTHARQSRIEIGAMAEAQPSWFRQLNLDPRDRIVAGVAARVVGNDQESLMASAWNQVVGVEEANRQLRLAQLALHVNASVHRRHVSALSESVLLGATRRVHAKLLERPGRTVHAVLAASSLPIAAVGPAFVRFQSRGAAELVVADDHLTADWVHTYRQPDTITGLHPAVTHLFTQSIVDQVDPGSTPTDLTATIAEALAAPGPERLLTVDLADRIGEYADRLPAMVAEQALRAALARMPTSAEVHDDPTRAPAAAAIALLSRRLTRIVSTLDETEVLLPTRLADRLGLDGRALRDRDETDGGHGPHGRPDPHDPGHRRQPERDDRGSDAGRGRDDPRHGPHRIDLHDVLRRLRTTLDDLRRDPGRFRLPPLFGGGDGHDRHGRDDRDGRPVGDARLTRRATAVGLDALLSWGAQRLEEARGIDPDLYLEAMDANAAAVQQRLDAVVRSAGERAPDAVRLVGGGLITTDEFAEPTRGRVDVPSLGLIAKLDPAVTVPARVQARLTMGTGRLPAWVRPGWFDDRRIEPVMACPRFDHPMYEALDRYDRDWLVPGLGLLERPDMATLLTTRTRFVEAFLVGLNHEMARELLWREYPTDQRGTYFSSFWTGQDELVAQLHEHAWTSGGLGAHVDQDLSGRLVLLVRGDLIRRYPGVVAHAVRQAQDAQGHLQEQDGVPLFEPGSATSPRRTLFHVHLAPNVLLVGFALSEEDVRSGDGTWWFTLSENPTEPRFGLDLSRDVAPPPAPPPGRDDLVWDDFAVAPGQMLDPGSPPALHFADPATGEDSRWGASSAQIARLLFQLPARAAYRATTMLDKAVP